MNAIYQKWIGNGEETVYRFEANTKPTTSTIEQSKAVKVATVWATQYYGVGNLTIVNGQEQSMIRRDEVGSLHQKAQFVDQRKFRIVVGDYPIRSGLRCRR